jgi:hypothetical protein
MNKAERFLLIGGSRNGTEIFADPQKNVIELSARKPNQIQHNEKERYIKQTFEYKGKGFEVFVLENLDPAESTELLLKIVGK